MRSNRSPLTFLTCFLCLFLLTTGFQLAFTQPVYAQDGEAETGEAATEQESTDSNQEQEQPATNPKPQSRPLIYVPFQKLSDVLNRVEGTLVISRAEYEALKKQLSNLLEQKTENPLDVVLMTSGYQAKVDGDLVSISVEHQFRVFNDRWSEFLLPAKNVAIKSVQSAENQVEFVTTPNGSLKLIFPKAGDYTVSLEYVVPVKKQEEMHQLNLAIPQTPVGTMEVTINTPDQQISAAQGAIVQTQTTQRQTSVASLRLTNSNQLNLQWQSLRSARPLMELLSSAQQQLLINIDENVIHQESRYQIQILRGELNSFRFAVPKGMRVLDVASKQQLKGWSVAEQETEQVLTVDLLAATTRKLELTIHCEQDRTEESLIPFGGIDSNNHPVSIKALDVVRETGSVWLGTTELLEIEVDAQQGLSRLDNSKVPQNWKPARYLGYQFYTPDYQLTGTIKEVKPQLRATQQVHYQLNERNHRMISQFQCEVTRAGLFEFVFELPENTMLQRVQSPGMGTYQYNAETRLLRVPYATKVMGNKQISLTLSFDLSLSDQQAPKPNVLPVIKLQNAESTEGMIAISAPISLEVIAQTEDFVNVFPQERDQLPSFLRVSTLLSSWSHSQAEYTLPVVVKQRPTRLTANLASVVNLDLQQSTIRTTLSFQIDYAPTELLRIAIPKAIQENTQFQLQGTSKRRIKQKQFVDSDDPLWTICELTLDQPTLGEISVIVSTDLLHQTSPKPEDASDTAEETETEKVEEATDGATELAKARLEETEGDAEAESNSSRYALTLPIPLDSRHRNGQAIPLLSMNGELVFEQQPQLTAEVKPADNEQASLRMIDLRELEKLTSTNGVAAYEYTSMSIAEPIRFGIRTTQAVVQDVVSSVVTRQLVECIVRRSKERLIRVRSVIRSSERQRLQIQLPAEMTIMDVWVDDEVRKLEPLATEENGTKKQYGLRITRTKDASEPFVVTILGMIKTEETPFRDLRGELNFQLPVLADKSGTPLIVQTSCVGIETAEDYQIVKVSQPFESLDPVSPFWVRSLFSRPDTRKMSTADLERWAGTPLPKTALEFPSLKAATAVIGYGSLSEVNVVWWKLSTFSIVISIAMLLIGFAVLRTTTINKISLLLLLILGLTVVAFRYPLAVNWSVWTGRYGFFCLLLLWVIYAVYQVFRWMTVECCRPAPLVPLEVPQQPQDSPAPQEAASPEHPTEETTSETSEPSENDEESPEEQ